MPDGAGDAEMIGRDGAFVDPWLFDLFFLMLAIVIFVGWVMVGSAITSSHVDCSACLCRAVAP